MSGDAPDGTPAVELFPHAFPPAEARQLTGRLVTETDWQQHRVRLFGREHDQPRLSAWQGDPGATYRYSGLVLEPSPWSEAVLAVRAVAERLAGQRFDSVLLNLYRDGNDSMGWHADDEPELGPEPVIASASFGASRRFVLRRRDDRATRFEIQLSSGSVLVMSGRTQADWQHHVPRQASVIEPRVNLTFRRVGRGS